MGLLQGPRLQALKAVEAPLGPRVPAAHAAVSGTPSGTASALAPIPPPVRICRWTKTNREEAGLIWGCQQG